MILPPAPARLPDFATLTKHVPASRKQMAQHLGISERTLAQYISRNSAPRSIMLALFWCTHWGRSAADCEAANFAAAQYQHAAALARENDSLRRRIARLEQLLTCQDVAGNAPFFINR